MQYNWITGENRQDNETLDAIAENFGVDPKTIRRWVKLKNIDRINARITQLAPFLTRHTGKMVTIEELQTRLKKAQALKRNEDSNVALPLQSLLSECLQACEQISVDQYLLEYCECDCIDDIHQRLLTRDPERCQSVLDELQRGIDHAVKQVDTSEALSILMRLIYTVALIQATPIIGDEETTLVGDVEDPGPICLLRLHIDAHLLSGGAVASEFSGSDYLNPIHAQGLVDSGSRSVRPPRVYKNTIPEYRLWRTAKSLDRQVLAKSRVPRPNTDANREQLFSFLRRLDIRVRRANKRGKHYFLLAPHKESDEYLALLKHHLSNLRVFRTAPRDGIPLFTLDAMETEVWLAECLYACAEREQELRPISMVAGSVVYRSEKHASSNVKEVVNNINVHGDFKGVVGDQGTTKNESREK